MDELLSQLIAEKEVEVTEALDVLMDTSHWCDSTVLVNLHTACGYMGGFAPLLLIPFEDAVEREIRRFGWMSDTAELVGPYRTTFAAYKVQVEHLRDLLTVDCDKCDEQALHRVPGTTECYCCEHCTDRLAAIHADVNDECEDCDKPATHIMPCANGYCCACFETWSEAQDA